MRFTQTTGKQLKKFQLDLITLSTLTDKQTKNIQSNFKQSQPAGIGIGIQLLIVSLHNSI